MPNIGYLARGYNIFYGNPRATEVGVDPGFEVHAGSPIYQQLYNSHTTGDLRYRLPDGFDAVRDSGCALDFIPTSSFSSLQFGVTFWKDVSSGFRIPLIAAFTGSTDYRAFFHLTRQKKQRMVTSTAECVVYDASVNSYTMPKLTDNFQTAISLLPDEYGNGEAWFDMFDTFGTHSVLGAKMGSRYGFSSYFSETSWTAVEKLGMSVTHVASVLGFFHATKHGIEPQAAQTFEQQMAEYREISLGAKPVADGDAAKWAQQVVQEPMPISYSLSPICNMFKDERKKANCNKAQTAGEYCTKRLKGTRGDIEICQDAQDIDCLWDADCKIGVCLNSTCVPGTQAQSIVLRSNSSLCLAIRRTLFVRRVVLGTCSSDKTQKWIFNSGEYENYMQIQPAGDTSLCIDGGSISKRQALTVKRCNGKLAQTWVRDMDVGAIFIARQNVEDMCLDGGSRKTSGQLTMLWPCNLLPQQQFDIGGLITRKVLALMV